MYILPTRSGTCICMYWRSGYVLASICQCLRESRLSVDVHLTLGAHIHVCTCMCIYASHPHTNTHMHTHTHTRACTRMHTHTHTHACMHTHTHTHTNTHTQRALEIGIEIGEFHGLSETVYGWYDISSSPLLVSTLPHTCRCGSSMRVIAIYI